MSLGDGMYECESDAYALDGVLRDRFSSPEGVAGLGGLIGTHSDAVVGDGDPGRLSQSLGRDADRPAGVRPRTEPRGLWVYGYRVNSAAFDPPRPNLDREVAKFGPAVY